MSATLLRPLTVRPDLEAAANRLIGWPGTVEQEGRLPEVRLLATDAPTPAPSGLEAVRRTVQKFWPTHWPLVEAQLSACATLLLKDVGQALALFAVGPSGAGKSTSLKMFSLPEREELVLKEAGVEPLVEPLDTFTLASFLSHFTDEKTDTAALEKRALYRILKHRVLLTPELSLMFRGNKAVLETMFSKLALILDGEGIRSASGTHGILGQKGDFSFVWLGGTTPFREETWRTMAQLGTRLLFYRVADGAANDVAEEDYSRARTECTEAVHVLLSGLLLPERRRTVAWPSISDERRATLQRLADLLASGQILRSGTFSEDEPARPSPNHFRMRLALVVRGRALLHGRASVDDEDLDLARQIARSSMPASRGPILLSLLEGGPQSAKELGAATGLVPQYVLKTLTNLEAVGVVAPDTKARWTLVSN